MAQQLYDPTTGKWYNYAANPSNTPTRSNVGWNFMTPESSADPGTPNLAEIKGNTPETPAGGQNLVAPEGKAQDIAAAVLAAQFKDWEDTYKPIELDLLGQSSLNNPGVLTTAVDNASTTANQTYDALSGVQSRRMMAQGVAPNAQQQAVSGRMMSLSRGAAVAGAENAARQQIATQDELIALGTAPNPNIVKSAGV